MLINVSVIGFIALSAYWFGFKEGFFSGVVHLACAIASGAIAFAFWEPFAFVMLSTGFGEFAWGVSMLFPYWAEDRNESRDSRTTELPSYH